MNKDNLKPVLDQFLNGKAGELQTKHIQMTPGMIERLEVFADEFGITTKECASFLLWAYLIDIEQRSQAVINNIMPKN